MHNCEIIHDKGKTRHSRTCLIIKKAHAFILRMLSAGKKPYVNPFDAVAEAQAKLRQEADAYRYFIQAGFVTNEELTKIYQWLNDKDGETKDKEGKIRIMILRKLPDCVLHEIVDPEKPRYQPSSLKYEIQKRMRLI